MQQKTVANSVTMAMAVTPTVATVVHKPEPGIQTCLCMSAEDLGDGWMMGGWMKDVGCLLLHAPMHVSAYMRAGVPVRACGPTCRADRDTLRFRAAAADPQLHVRPDAVHASRLQGGDVQQRLLR